MDTVTIIPRQLKGTIQVPPSKSIAHRAVICAGLADGQSTIRQIAFSDDIQATMAGMSALGVSITKADQDGEAILQISGGLIDGDKVIDCGESGSTLRFLIPLALIKNGQTTFQGRGKLGERPLLDYYQIFDQQGIGYTTVGGRLPLQVQGRLQAGTIQISGQTSSQFVSGLLFALPLLPGDSQIQITTELESKGYVDLTMDVLAKFGVKIIKAGERLFQIPGGQRYRPTDFTVEADYSQAAFWLVAGILGADLACRGLNQDSLQGDKVILSIIERMDGKIVANDQTIQALPGKTRGVEVDVSQCPDLVPILAVMAAFSEGQTRIINGARLRLKESDRLAAMAGELTKIGAIIKEEKDGLVIEGQSSLAGGRVESWNDHRIAMALAIAGMRCREPLVIAGSEAVNKSYPNFWADYGALGGEIHGRNLG